MALPGRRHASFGMDAAAADGDWGLAGDADGMGLCRGGNRLMDAGRLRVAGQHNAVNALAAGALCHLIGVPDTAIVTGWAGFDGLPHRVKLINKINNIEFYDDSKGTNVGATVAALTGFAAPVVLIAGGDGKGQDFSPLADAARGRARAVVLIGRDAPQIAAAIGDAAPLLYAGDMDEAVQMASAAARPGDAVLLSPACASYDMFRNYVHRAEVFAAAVAALQRSRA